MKLKMSSSNVSNRRGKRNKTKENKGTLENYWILLKENT